MGCCVFIGFCVQVVGMSCQVYVFCNQFDNGYSIQDGYQVSVFGVVDQVDW